MENKITDLLSEWENTRPVQGRLSADVALSTISAFEVKLTRVQEEYDLVCRAKEALGLELVKHQRLDPAIEEMRDLKGVWTALSGIWSQIGELREMVWATVQVCRAKYLLDYMELTTLMHVPLCSLANCVSI